MAAMGPSRLRSRLLYFVAFLLFVASTFAHDTAKDESKNPEHGLSEHEEPEDEEEEEHEEVLAKWDGKNISLCVFGILTALISITCLFEFIKEGIYERTLPATRPIVDALFSEMTVLGFLSMVTFLVASEGFIARISARVFGPSKEGEEYLKQLFEQAHYMLFVVMVVFFGVALHVLASNNKNVKFLGSLRDKVLRPECMQEMLSVAHKPRPEFSLLDQSARKAHDEACEFLEYASMRLEFIRGRRGDFPHRELSPREWLPADFDYAKYLSIKMGELVAETIEVGPATWLQLWLLELAFYGLSLAFPPQGKDTALVVCFAWLALGYLEAWCVLRFLAHVKRVRWCLCCPEEIPHVAFSWRGGTGGKPHAELKDWSKGPAKKQSKGSPGAYRSFDSNGRYEITPKMSEQHQAQAAAAAAAAAQRQASRLEAGSVRSKGSANDQTHEQPGSPPSRSPPSRSPSRSSRSRGQGGAFGNKGAPGDSSGPGRPSPAWASIAANPKDRTAWQMWLGGRAPFRQLQVYWCEAHGPPLFVALLRFHLVYFAIQLTVGPLVLAPLVKEHAGPWAYWGYVAAPLPHALHSLACVLGPLTRAVAEVSACGVLADPRAKKDVLRMMKTAKSVKGIMLLSHMKDFVSSASPHTHSCRERGLLPGSLKGAYPQQSGGNGAAGNGGAVDFGEALGEADVEAMAEEIFVEKFDTESEGWVGLEDFRIGLAGLATFSASEAQQLFSEAEAESHSGKRNKRVDLSGFKRFVKKYASKEECGLANGSGVSGERVQVAAKLYTALETRLGHRAARSHAVGQLGGAASGRTTGWKEPPSSPSRAPGTAGGGKAGGAAMSGGLAKPGGKRLTPEEELALLQREHGLAVHEIVMLFQQHDVDGSGHLEEAEVLHMLGAIGEDPTAAQAGQLMRLLDRDGDGKVSEAEFVLWAFHHQLEQASKGHEGVEELAGRIFDQVFDLGGDGKIDVNEFIVGLERCKADLSYDEKHEMFREADENGGGFIDKHEFTELMLKYSN